MFRRHHALVAVCCLPVIGLLSAGCADDTKATPQVIFEGTLSRGAGTDCKDSGTVFTVGDFGTPALDKASSPKKDGEAAEQGTVSVSCAVTSAGSDAFNVDATVALSGATGGLFHVDGVFKASGEQTGIHAIFSSRRSSNSYEESDRNCTVHYDSTFQGVALGRVWGVIECPNVVNSGAQTSCAAKATFRFENCSQ